MKSILQKKLLILSIIFFIYSYFVFFLLYRGVSNNKEISLVAQEKWQTETTNKENAKLLINSVKAVEPERALLETHFVQSSDVVPFLDTIEKITKKVGAKAEIISVNIAKNNSSLILRMKVSGSFDTIYKLILLLENSPYDLDFVLMNIQTSNESIKKVPQWTANFKIRLLSFIK